MPRPYASILRKAEAFHAAARVLLACGLALAQTPSLAADCPAATTLQYEVLEQRPHSQQAFTQGLTFAAGQLVESTGLYGQSRLILHTPAGSQHSALPQHRFGEGLAWFDQRLWQLSWKAGELRIYRLQPLRLDAIWRYRGEGWGLTHDGEHFIMSDGSAELLIRRSEDFELLRRIRVRDGAKPLPHLNELEWIEGQVWANVWQQDRIARIDPHSGCVSGWLQLHELWPRMIRPRTADVLNGIAWHPKKREFWVTGKNWPRLYRLKIDALHGDKS